MPTLCTIELCSKLWGLLPQRESLRQDLIHILVSQIAPCFRKGQNLPAHPLKMDDRQLALERITDYVTSRAARLFANFVEQLPGATSGPSPRGQRPRTAPGASLRRTEQYR